MKRTTPNYLLQGAFPEPKRRTIVEVQTNPCFKKGVHQTNLIEATAGASTIQVLRDDPTATVLNIPVNPERMDRLVFHPDATPLVMDGETYNNAFHWIPSAKKPK
jgi:hypothetical protein